MEILHNEPRSNTVWIKNNGFIFLFIQDRVVAVARAGIVLKNEDWDFPIEHSLEHFASAVNYGEPIKRKNGISLDPVLEVSRDSLRWINQDDLSSGEQQERFYLLRDNALGPAKKGQSDPGYEATSVVS